MRAILLPLILLLAATLAPGAARAALPGLTEGVHYTLIEDGTPYRPVAGKVEVAEVFAYTCPHCAHLAPMLETWKRKLPAHAQLVLVPGVFNREDPFARAFFAAESSKSVPVLHPRLFAALHKTEELPRNATPAQLRAFVGTVKGVDLAAFDRALKDDASLLPKLQHAYQFAARSKIQGTPALVVAGRYLVLGNSYESLLANAARIVKALPPPARPAAKAAAKPRT